MSWGERLTAVWPGRPYPHGATWDGEGVNFALFSEHAEKVELCLFDDGDRETSIEMSERTVRLMQESRARPSEAAGR